MNQKHQGDPPPAARIYELLIDEDDSLAEQLPDPVAAAVPANALKQIIASALQKAGDLTVDAKTVLAWLLAGVGAPAVITGLLVRPRRADGLRAVPRGPHLPPFRPGPDPAAGVGPVVALRGRPGHPGGWCGGWPGSVRS